MDHDAVALLLPHTVPIARKSTTVLTVGENIDRIGAPYGLDIGDTSWVQENASRILTTRRYSAAMVEMARRFCTGQTPPNGFMPSTKELARAYCHIGTREEI
jgi:hypothetical protein